MQQGTSREAEATARELGRLPYARSSFESVGPQVGAHYSQIRADVEEVPKAEREGQSGRQVCRHFRMAYCATVTLHDSEGQAVYTVRYRRMPQGDVDTLGAGLAENV